MITLDDSYARDLPGTYVPWKPVPVAAASVRAGAMWKAAPSSNA